MRAQAEKAYKEALVNGAFYKQTLDRNILSGLHKAIRFRVYTIALEKIGMEQNITFAQGMNIDKILLSESPSAMCDLTDGYVALREYDRLAFQSGSLKKNVGEFNIKTMTRAEFDEYKKINCSVARSKLVYGAFCGVNPNELCVRTRKPGDKINTGNGTKKIQDFFVDQKVPKHSRDSILLLAKGSDVLWVIPSEEFPSENMRHKGRFSADYKVTDNGDDLVIVLEKLCSI
jgi:tRNA(Ile)-lysidine synthase